MPAPLTERVTSTSAPIVMTDVEVLVLVKLIFADPAPPTVTLPTGVSTVSVESTFDPLKVRAVVADIAVPLKVVIPDA